MRVLVADDDFTYRSLLQDLLTKWHFEVVLTSDGLEAMEVMTGKDPPPLVILDWEMPGMDGFQVAKKIRSQNFAKEPYVLMITGSRKKGDMMQVMICGADDYLIKPFDPMDLKIHLRSAMRIISLMEEVDELKQSASSQDSGVQWHCS